MSRIANNPISVPKGVNITINGQEFGIKGTKGNLNFRIHDAVNVVYQDEHLKVAARDESSEADALAGCTRALLNNMVIGVTEGFTQKLELIGVGYRAQVQGNKLNLTLGFSHPIAFDIPEHITIETPSQTEIIVKGLDKQLVGHVAAKIRGYRPPEPYKGKGVRYANEQIKRKETKKK